MYISKEKGCRTSPETKLVVKPIYKPMDQSSAAESFIILIISDGIGCQPHPIIVHSKYPYFSNTSKVELNSDKLSENISCISADSLVKHRLYAW